MAVGMAPGGTSSDSRTEDEAGPLLDSDSWMPCISSSVNVGSGMDGYTPSSVGIGGPGETSGESPNGADAITAVNPPAAGGSGNSHATSHVRSFRNRAGGETENVGFDTESAELSNWRTTKMASVPLTGRAWPVNTTLTRGGGGMDSMSIFVRLSSVDSEGA